MAHITSPGARAPRTAENRGAGRTRRVAHGEAVTHTATRRTRMLLATEDDAGMNPWGLLDLYYLLRRLGRVARQVRRKYPKRV